MWIISNPFSVYLLKSSIIAYPKRRVSRRFSSFFFYLSLFLSLLHLYSFFFKPLNTKVPCKESRASCVTGTTSPFDEKISSGLPTSLALRPLLPEILSAAMSYYGNWQPIISLTNQWLMGWWISLSKAKTWDLIEISFMLLLRFFLRKGHTFLIAQYIKQCKWVCCNYAPNMGKKNFIAR